jgi:Cys-tRNA(Pro)/Cys-tRNA(Cys) deacylase
VDEAALTHPKVFVNGGLRGLQAELAPADLVSILGARLAALT